MQATGWSVLTLALAAGAVLLTLAAVLLAVNLSGGERKLEQRLQRLYALDDPRFAQEVGVMLGPPFLDGNRVQALHNGDHIFPAMLAAIQSAATSITFETFIYWSGDIGRTMAEALAERARTGVAVHVLLDWVGSAKMDAALVDVLESAGVQLRRFHPPHWTHLRHFNNRTHRKLLVIDGRLAFTGGVGVAPQWTGRAQDPQHWRDSHFKVEGPVVAQMQSVFMNNWIKVTGEVLNGPHYFPALESQGPCRAQMFSSSPSGGSESMQLMYLMAITAAARSIDLSASYFVPDDLSMRALVDALARGVTLRVIVPGAHIDRDTVRRASRARWEPLLRAGATIAEYRPTMYHCKLMIVDRQLVSVGSTNFDNRSFRLNDEATLNVLDTDFAAALTTTFEADLANSSGMSLAEWRARPWRERLGDRAAALLRSQL